MIRNNNLKRKNKFDNLPKMQFGFSNRKRKNYKFNLKFFTQKNINDFDL